MCGETFGCCVGQPCELLCLQLELPALHQCQSPVTSLLWVRETRDWPRARPQARFCGVGSILRDTPQGPGCRILCVGEFWPLRGWVGQRMMLDPVVAVPPLLPAPLHGECAASVPAPLQGGDSSSQHTEELSGCLLSLCLQQPNPTASQGHPRCVPHPTPNARGVFISYNSKC